RFVSLFSRLLHLVQAIEQHNSLSSSQYMSTNRKASGNPQISNCFNKKGIRARPESDHSLRPTKIGILLSCPCVARSAMYLRNVVLPAPGLPRMKSRLRPELLTRSSPFLRLELALIRSGSFFSSSISNLW